MTMRGKQRLPLARQSIAKAFRVILAHAYTQTWAYTYRQQGDTLQGHLNHIQVHLHKNLSGIASLFTSMYGIMPSSALSIYSNLMLVALPL